MGAWAPLSPAGGRIKEGVFFKLISVLIELGRGLRHDDSVYFVNEEIPGAGILFPKYFLVIADLILHLLV